MQNIIDDDCQDGDVLTSSLEVKTRIGKRLGVVQSRENTLQVIIEQSGRLLQAADAVVAGEAGIAGDVHTFRLEQVHALVRGKNTIKKDSVNVMLGEAERGFSSQRSRKRSGWWWRKPQVRKSRRSHESRPYF